MNIKNFYTVMRSLDDDLLEEAKKPLHKKKPKLHWYFVAAACLFLVIVFQFPSQQSEVTASDLLEKGYDIFVPKDADHVSYSLTEDAKKQTAQAEFSLDGDKYIYHVTKGTQPTEETTQTESDTIISWNSKGLDLSLKESNSAASVNWYSSSANTSHTLSTSAENDNLLSTARQVLLLTGLDVANAPDGAENIKYSVFSYNELVVAETSFLYENNMYSYRMAATIEIAEDFADISEMKDDFSVTVPGDVAYCRAKIALHPNERGKIIWFDVVPGIVYSLSTENNASEEVLLHLANELFQPIQGNAE